MDILQFIALRSKAENGDIEAYFKILNHYSNKKAAYSDISGLDEAIEISIKMVESGNPIYVMGAASLTCSRALIASETAQSEHQYDNAVALFLESKKWCDKAVELKLPDADALNALFSVNFGVALCKKASATNDADAKRLIISTALDTLSFACEYGNDLEAKIIYVLNAENLKLSNPRISNVFKYAHDCVDNHFNEHPCMKKIAYLLGVLYMRDNSANSRDYTKAHHYLTIANNAGFDCSDLLSKFKKNLFGSWKYSGNP